MRNLKVKYVPKSELYPYFGQVNTKTRTIKISRDLSKLERKFVLSHEIHHILNSNKLEKANKYYLIIAEIKANMYGAVRHPIGFLILNIKNFNLSRFKLWWKRFRYEL